MNILITGVSGVGKTTLCTYLKQSGHVAFDMDDIPNLCQLYHPDGTGVTPSEDRTKLNMLETDFFCNSGLLHKHIKSQSGTTFYLGYIDNFRDIAELFDKIFLLTISHEENKHRMSIRTTTDFAKEEKTQNELLAYKDEYEDSVLKHQAIKIDASGSTQAIANEILAKLD